MQKMLNKMQKTRFVRFYVTYLLKRCQENLRSRLVHHTKPATLEGLGPYWSCSTLSQQHRTQDSRSCRSCSQGFIQDWKFGGVQMKAGGV